MRRDFFIPGQNKIETETCFPLFIVLYINWGRVSVCVCVCSHLVVVVMRLYIFLRNYFSFSIPLEGKGRGLEGGAG